MPESGWGQKQNDFSLHGTGQERSALTSEEEFRRGTQVRGGKGRVPGIRPHREGLSPERLEDWPEWPSNLATG